MTRAELRETSNNPEIKKNYAKLRFRQVHIHRQLIFGQLWADSIYEHVRDSAEKGIRVYVSEIPPMSEIAYKYSRDCLNRYFPDSTIAILHQGGINTIVVSWV